MNFVGNFVGTVTGSCVAHSLCFVGSSIMNSIPNGRVSHITLTVFVFLLSWVTYLWGFEFLWFIPQLQYCEDAGSDILTWSQDASTSSSGSHDRTFYLGDASLVDKSLFVPVCYGVLSVHRFGLALVVHQIAHAISAAFGMSTDGHLPLRLIFYVLLLVLSFMLPNNVIIIYTWILSVVSVLLYTISQMAFILITINAKTIVWTNRENKFLLWTWVIILLILYLMLSLFVWAVDVSHASIILTLLVFAGTCIFAFISTSTAIQEAHEGHKTNSSIIHALGAGTFTILIIASVVYFGPDAHCAHCSGHDRWSGAGFVIVLLEFLLAIATIFISMSGQCGYMAIDDQKEKVDDPEEADSDDDGEAVDVPTSCVKQESCSERADFHVTIAFAIGYISFLITEWYGLSVPAGHNIATTTSVYVVRSTWMYWYRAVVAFIAFMISVWMTVAPYCMPDRSW